MTGPADEALFEAVGQQLQSSPQSIFRENLICQLMTDDGTHSLVGRTYSAADKSNDEKHLLESEDELLSLLKDVYGIEVEKPLGLWDQVVARHEALFGSDDE